jgi:hypothetical protein
VVGSHVGGGFSCKVIQFNGGDTLIYTRNNL